MDLGKCNCLEGIYFPRFPSITSSACFGVSRSDFSCSGHILFFIMMKKIALLALPVVFLAGCSIQEVAQSAGDAAACNALKGTLTGLQTAYEAGLVDSGVLDQVDELVGDQLEALLSSGLASDLRQLSTELANTDSAQAASARIGSLTASIAERCEAVGVNVE